MLKTILKKECPNWVKDISYAVMLLETIMVVIIYHTPDLFVKVITWFI